MATHPLSTPPECEIVSTRTFSFPKALVYEAWTNPEHLKQWWGPAGFTNTFHEFDLRVGGRWRFTMHGPEKGNYENDVEFTHIGKPSFIAWKRHSKPLFNIAVSFEEAGKDSTKVIFRMQFDTPEECEKLKPYVVDKNEENFDRLEVVLEKMV